MSSRMAATAGWMRRASSHDENGTSVEMKGVFSGRRRGICALSRNSNSLPPCKKGETSNERAIATSVLGYRQLALPLGRTAYRDSRYCELAYQPMETEGTKATPGSDHASKATQVSP